MIKKRWVQRVIVIGIVMAVIGFAGRKLLAAPTAERPAYNQKEIAGRTKEGVRGIYSESITDTEVYTVHNHDSEEADTQIAELNLSCRELYEYLQ